jgi:hypothetical protein
MFFGGVGGLLSAGPSQRGRQKWGAAPAQLTHPPRRRRGGGEAEAGRGGGWRARDGVLGGRAGATSKGWPASDGHDVADTGPNLPPPLARTPRVRRPVSHRVPARGDRFCQQKANKA